MNAHPLTRIVVLLLRLLLGFGVYSFLQALFFGVGLLELIAVTALLGIAPRILPAWSGVPLRGTFGLRRTDARGAS